MRPLSDPQRSRVLPPAGAAAAVIILGLLNACTVGPDYVRPRVDIPAAFKEAAGNDEWKVGRPSDEAARGKWWAVFRDPRLDALESQVDLSNQNIVAAAAQYRQAVALVQATRAGFFPTVTAGATAARRRGSASTPISSPAIVGPNNDFILPLQVSWEADVWGRIRRSVESSRANAQAFAADLENVRLSVQAELALAYFELRGVDADRALLDKTIAAYQDALALTRNRFEIGIASLTDVAQAQTQLKTTQAQAIALGVQRAQLEHAIAVLLGKAPAAFSMPAAPLDATPPAVPPGLPSAQLERRPDVAAAERLVAAANAQIGVAQAAFYPTVTLSGVAGFESSSASNWLSWPSRLWAVGPAISQILFDGGLRQALTDEARAAYDANVASYRNTVLVAFRDVEDNLAALHVLAEEAQTQNEAVKAAQRSLELTTNRYQAGAV